jgi:hypothetical protein
MITFQEFLNEIKSFVGKSNPRKSAVAKILGGKCLKCGIDYTENNSVIFDLHHVNVDRGQGYKNSMLSLSYRDLYQVLDKCILVCSNCHRLIHDETSVKESVLSKRIETSKKSGVGLGRPIVKINWEELEKTKEKYNVSENVARKILGYSQSTFYAAKKLKKVEK